jgi:ankyrin repeat protein
VLGCAVSQDNVMTVKAIWELMDEFKMQQKDQLGGSLCLHAASCGSKDTMQMLLEQGVSVNYQNETGVSAIHAATSNGQVLIMELLIEKGANVNIISTVRVFDGINTLLR